MAKDSGKTSFVYYLEWADELLKLPEDLRLKIDDAIKRYVLYGEEPTDREVLYSMFGLMRKQIDRDAEKWNDIRCKRREAGAKGAAVTNRQKSANSANAAKSRQKSANSAVNVDANVNVDVDDIIDSSLHSESPLSNDNVSTLAQESEGVRMFKRWLESNCPYIFKHYTLPTEKELEKLKQQYGSNTIAETCQQIENRKDLRKRYSNLYRTLLNWMKRDRPAEDDAKARRAQDAANIIASLAERERRDNGVTNMMMELAAEE